MRGGEPAAASSGAASGENQRSVCCGVAWRSAAWRRSAAGNSSIALWHRRNNQQQRRISSNGKRMSRINVKQHHGKKNKPLNSALWRALYSASTRYAARAARSKQYRYIAWQHQQAKAPYGWLRRISRGKKISSADVNGSSVKPQRSRRGKRGNLRRGENKGEGGVAIAVYLLFLFHC